ncbi:MAG TPA: response regulator transcription factor [Chitinophagaceae bacterium]|jgi:DNA-binding NarL/FixJ family response regulator|nr:response regulator transcription factor [Chitinophagaceae bacterium]
MIKIVIADDHKLFRETLSIVLNSNPELRVIASCQDSAEAIEIIRAEKPDIVLMDIDIPPFSGIEAVRKICTIAGTRVIGLSMHTHPAYARKMMRAGALGYVTKNSSKEEIFTAILEVNHGNKFLCSEIKTLISEELLSDNDTTPHIGMLTERELEIISYVKEGLSSKEIAGSINVALKTVEVHRHNILKKLKLKNASSLVNFMHSNAGFVA